MMPGRNWHPRHRAGGTIFCSPACGGDCKRADYDRATKRAEALAKRLGAGWNATVWENLGWHYKVVKGLLEVYPHHDRSRRRPRSPVDFTAYLQGQPQFVERGGTAELAIKAVVGTAEATARRIKRTIAGLDPKVLR